MALPIAAAVAGGTALTAYLDARLLLRHDNAAPNPDKLKIQAMQNAMQRFQSNRLLVYHALEERATGKSANDLFLMFEGRTWTYKQFLDALQPVANWLMNDLGIKRGDMVGLDGSNSPEYLMLWFAIDGIGACPAFINSNLTSTPLIHCVKLCDAKYLMADSEQKNLLHSCEKELEAADINIKYYDSDLFKTFTDTTPIPRARQSGHRPDQISCLIYTSGTTGMPKGTILNRAKDMNLVWLGNLNIGLKPGDRIYTCLPLYHGAAHGLCVLPAIGGGATVVLSRKFSHARFWPEVRASNANVIQYVGELCRYLMNAPPSPLDKQHSVKVAWGNGMRPDVWEPFRQRFGIECIHELYAATDGLGSTVNANNGPFGRNAIAVRGLLWHLRHSANEKRVRMDIESEEIVRDKDGFAIECRVGEPGEVLHRLDPATPDAAFAGYYKNREAGDKRKIKDVFKKGDLWFRSGDMMRQDWDGLLYFVDRLGDTFRWKSENVSTNEVSDVMGQWRQIAEANVYGVLVPNADGRAGCAAIVPTEDVGTDLSKFDFSGLAKHAVATLPRYAVPIFLRVVKQLEYTGTMKLQKGRLRGEGIDLEKVRKAEDEKGTARDEERDRFYWLPPGKDEYVPFDQRQLDELRAGKVRL